MALTVASNARCWRKAARGSLVSVRGHSSETGWGPRDSRPRPVRLRRSGPRRACGEPALLRRARRKACSSFPYSLASDTIRDTGVTLDQG